MLGVPLVNREHIREWSRTMIDSDGSSREERRGNMWAFSNYIVQLVAKKRKHPQDDLISQLIQQEEEKRWK